MACYFPLKAYIDKGSNAYKYKLVFRRSESWKGESIDLPCGRCIGCRLEKSRQWAVRCMHEASLYENNCFLTLTYNDENLPSNWSLIKEEFPLFMKRLRKKYGEGIRYYHCGEYGEKNKRPHYHAIVFNHDFEDKVFHKMSGTNKLYTSESLDKLWSKGFATLGDVTFESAGYVARYAMKKITGENAIEYYGGRVPEYSTMSRGSKKIGTGGIGKGWYDKYKSDVYPLDRVVVRGSLSRPPRFYDNLLRAEDPSTLALIKLERQKNGQRYVEDVLRNGRLVKVSDTSSGRLVIREGVKKAEIENLKRILEE